MSKKVAENGSAQLTAGIITCKHCAQLFTPGAPIVGMSEEQRTTMLIQQLSAHTIEKHSAKCRVYQIGPNQFMPEELVMAQAFGTLLFVSQHFDSQDAALDDYRAKVWDAVRKACESPSPVPSPSSPGEASDAATRPEPDA